MKHFVSVQLTVPGSLSLFAQGLLSGGRLSNLYFITPHSFASNGSRVEDIWKNFKDSF
jgi:hypothetical protein